MTVRARVHGLPPWVDAHRLLGAGSWSESQDGWSAELEREQAADLQARLRGLGIGGAKLEVEIQPPLKRRLVREARAEDARRRRDTTPGFTRSGALLDDEGRMSLTPEVLALELGERGCAASVIDATAGCGGNAIGFARAGSRVVGIEPDPGRLEMARHNASLFGVADRVELVLGRAEDQVPSRGAALLFADPPWGADWNRERTAIDAIPLLPALLALSERFERTWLKLPPSFDASALPEWRPSAWFGRAPGDRQRVKFLILERHRG